MHNFKISNGDTDSITIYKEDQSIFLKEEREALLKELNNSCPEGLVWEDDGFYPVMIVLRAKNYILWDGKKLIQKGSSLKSSTLEPALKEFLNEIIYAIIHDRGEYEKIYYKFVKEINDVKDIKRWCSKKTLSDTTYESSRENEAKIIRAIQGTEYVSGDKVYLYFKSDDSLNLAERFDGDYNKDRLWEKLYKATDRFATIMDVDKLFPNFKLKRNKELLEEVLK